MIITGIKNIILKFTHTHTKKKGIINVSIIVFKMTDYSLVKEKPCFQRFSALRKKMHQIQIIRLSTGITVQKYS